ncbi:hypothetical protein UNH65_02130 [Chitinophaga sp. 180180018-2]|nr:hypothetical protein [Chitinophaga sp. 212800010-3]
MGRQSHTTHVKIAFIKVKLEVVPWLASPDLYL